ncbi:MAG: serine/threonine protein phosphatase [Sinomicrobium sp.]|nr:serine/threonine protein phosphatase [Sinomicrobium sp.]
MEGRTLVIGDIHGAYKALQQALERAAVTPDDTLIFLGDYVDGWSQSPEVIGFLIRLQQTQRCIFIKGNHDDLLLQWLRDKKHNEQWLANGGQATVEAYRHIEDSIRVRHVLFLESLREYYIDAEKRLFVHAGFTNQRGVAFEYFPQLFYWDRTLWETALALDPSLSEDDVNYPPRLRSYREIYIGHTPVTRIGKTVPVHAANVWNVDTGAAYKSPLTVLDIHTKMYWQSDNANDLYPGERGRN